MSQELTDERIKEFLQTAALYQWYSFGKPRINRDSLLIEQIEVYCSTCRKERPFRDPNPRGGGAGMTVKAVTTGETLFEFRCLTCKTERRIFCVRQVFEDDVVCMQKFGEFPRPPLQRNKELHEFFATDLDLYEKAVTSLANGYGIGAFAYFRRLLENHISDLLDKVQADLEETGGEAHHLAEIEKLRKDSPMSEKIDIANRALPNYLTPQGTNPLGRMYQVLSAGVHSFSEDECMEKAKGVEAALRYLVSELRSRQMRKQDFERGIRGL